MAVCDCGHNTTVRSGNVPPPLASLPKGKLYYRIGEVAKITDVKPHVLRYWETEFGALRPKKSRSGQRQRVGRVGIPTFGGGERPVNGAPPLALRLRTKALCGGRSNSLTSAGCSGAGGGSSR